MKTLFLILLIAINSTKADTNVLWSNTGVFAHSFFADYSSTATVDMSNGGFKTLIVTNIFKDGGGAFKFYSELLTNDTHITETWWIEIGDAPKVRTFIDSRLKPKALPLPKFKSDYERGLEDGMSTLSLVNLERVILQTNWNFLQMSNIVKRRMLPAYDK